MCMNDSRLQEQTVSLGKEGTFVECCVRIISHIRKSTLIFPVAKFRLCISPILCSEQGAATQGSVPGTYFSYRAPVSFMGSVEGSVVWRKQGAQCGRSHGQVDNMKTLHREEGVKASIWASYGHTICQWLGFGFGRGCLPLINQSISPQASLQQPQQVVCGVWWWRRLEKAV